MNTSDITVRLDHAAAALASAVGSPMELEDRLIQLLDEVRPPLYRYLLFLGATPGEADELIQETMIRLFDHLQARKSEDNLRGWVFRVAHNLAVNQVRGRKYLEPLKSEQWQALLSAQRDPALGPEEILLEKEKMARFDAAIAMLSPLQRQCVHLRVEGFRYREIADILGVAIPTVSESLRRAISRLSRDVNE